jgi:hypothetical protein
MRSLISSSFSETTFFNEDISLSLLLILSSKYYLIPISCVPRNAFIFTRSSSMAALDSNCKLSINPLERPNYWAIDAFTSWRCSYCFFNLTLFFYKTSILSSRSFISCSYFSLLWVKVLIFSSFWRNWSSIWSFTLLT